MDFNPNYAGPSYSVKYLGIVDGSMGVLSRKMALQYQRNNAQNKSANHYTKATEHRYDSHTNSPKIVRGHKEEKTKFNIVAPILKKKYAQIVMDRAKELDEKTRGKFESTLKNVMDFRPMSRGQNMFSDLGVGETIKTTVHADNAV